MICGPICTYLCITCVYLGIIPLQADSHSFVTDQRKQEYKGLTHALQVMKIVDNNTPKPQIFFAAWLLQSGNLRFDINLQVNIFVSNNCTKNYF